MAWLERELARLRNQSEKTPMNDLDEAEQNIPKITTEPDPTGYTRRALECIVAHLRNEYAMVIALIKHTHLPECAVRVPREVVEELKAQCKYEAPGDPAAKSELERPSDEELKLAFLAGGSGWTSEMGLRSVADYVLRWERQHMVAFAEFTGYHETADRLRRGERATWPGSEAPDAEAEEATDEEIDAIELEATEYFWAHFRELLKGRGTNGSLGNEEDRYVHRAIYNAGRAPLLAEIAELRSQLEKWVHAEAAAVDANVALGAEGLNHKQRADRLEALLPVARAAVRLRDCKWPVKYASKTTSDLNSAVDALPPDVREELGKS